MLHDNAVVGSAILVAGAVQLFLLSVDSTTWNITMATITIGLGIGAGSSLYTTVVQNAVKQTLMGQATGAVTLFRQIGGTVGLAIFGSIVNTTSIAGGAGKLAFAAALHHVFIGVVAVACLAMVTSWFLKEIPLKSHEETPPSSGH